MSFIFLFHHSNKKIVSLYSCSHIVVESPWRRQWLFVKFCSKYWYWKRKKLRSSLNFKKTIFVCFYFLLEVDKSMKVNLFLCFKVVRKSNNLNETKRKRARETAKKTTNKTTIKIDDNNFKCKFWKLTSFFSLKDSKRVVEKKKKKTIKIKNFNVYFYVWYDNCFFWFEKFKFNFFFIIIFCIIKFFFNNSWIFIFKRSFFRTCFSTNLGTYCKTDL